MSELPIAAVADEVCQSLKLGNVVLQAEPGAGKSTGLPLVLLKAEFDGKILMLEPRRLAARNVAARLASQLGESVGQTIGLRMRGKTSVSRLTKLEVVTEGVLTRILQNDPLLEGISVVIFDEFHERSLHADLGLTLCLDVQRDVRDDLRILLMSATLDGDTLSKHIDAEKPISCHVRQHPVEIIWSGTSRAPLAQVVAETVLKATQEHIGDALIFLPGVAEIEKTARYLENKLPDDCTLHKLHSGTSTDAQLAATAAGSQHSRRIILSTSIAETSLTIDGVRIVVDAGVERRSTIDGSSGIERLETVMASRASATQRAGRAGRTESGVCYRLWSEDSHSARAASWQPEVLRADISSLLLELGQWGVKDVSSLPWIDIPSQSSIDRAVGVLEFLGVWNNDGLSEHGRAVAKLPVEPRFGHMMLWGARHGAGPLAVQLVSLLEDMPRRQSADFTELLRKPLRQHTRRAEQLSKQLGNQFEVNDSNLDCTEPAVLLARAYPERIAKRRSGTRADQDARYLLSGGSGAVLHGDDALVQSEYLVAAQLGGQGREARVFAALPIDTGLLNAWCSDLIETHDVVAWDDRHERVVAEQQRRIGALVLDSTTIRSPDKALRSTALINAVRKKGLQCLDFNDDLREWQARVTRMRSLETDDTTYPAVDDISLLAGLEQWLQPFVADITSMKVLKQLQLQPVLSSLLNYQQIQRLDDWLPVRYKVPSGSEHKLRYNVDGNPVLAVKLQEMFGCRDNPTIAGGRVALKVELLSPARRPVQVTEDLANFWHNSYADVKKDLAGRYPKHPWPDDPINAKATAYTKHRKPKP